MKFKRFFFFVLLAAAMSLLLSACGAAPATNWPGVSTSGELIYLADGRAVYSVQVSNGMEVTATVGGSTSPLRFPMQADGNKSFYGQPAVTADGTLIVGNAAAGENSLFAVNASTGDVKWSFPAEKPWLAGVLVLNQTVFAPAGDGKLYALDLAGNQQWAKQLSDHALWTTPVTDGVSVYVATLDHLLYSLSPTGDVNWKVELDNGIIGSPAVLDGIVYVGTLSGNLYALKAQEGSQLWVQPLEGNIWGTPGVDLQSGKVFIGTVFGTAGKFYALSLKTGQVAWSNDEEGSIIAGPLVTPDQVVYGTETGRVQSVNKDGAPLWQDNFAKNKIYTAPILAGDLIVVAPMGSDFLLAAYNANGTQKWTFTPAK